MLALHWDTLDTCVRVCMCATLACMPSFHLFLLALPRGIHDHVDEAVHVLRVGNVVDSPWRLRPRGSSVLEAVNLAMCVHMSACMCIHACIHTDDIDEHMHTCIHAYMHGYTHG